MKKLFLTILAAITPIITSAESKNPIVSMKTSHGEITIELLQKSAPKTVKNFIDLAQGTKEFTDALGQKIKKPFYDGLTFHRVIDGFMIQGGCPVGNGSGNPGYKFSDEINANSLGLDKAKVIHPEKGMHEYLRVYPPQKIQQMIVQPIFKKLGITTQQQLDQKQNQIQAEHQKIIKTLTLKNLYEGIGYKYNDKLKSFPMKTGFLAMANSGPNSNGCQFYINLVDNNYLDGKHTVFGKVIKGIEVVQKIAKVKTGSRSKPLTPVKIISIRLKK